MAGASMAAEVVPYCRIAVLLVIEDQAAKPPLSRGNTSRRVSGACF